MVHIIQIKIALSVRATNVNVSFIFEVDNIGIGVVLVTEKMEETLTLVALREIPREVKGLGICIHKQSHVPL